MLALAEPDRASFVELNRTRLRLWEWGDPSDPPLVLVHGAYDHGRMFDGIAPRLAALGYHTVAIDLRGHGDSGRLPSGQAWVAMNLDLGLLARHLGSPVRFLGHSFGGGQAVSAAGIFPDDVAWVVSIDGLGPPATAFENADFAAMAASGFDSAERLWAKGPREYVSLEDMASRRRRINVRMSEEWAAHLVAHGAAPGPGGGWRWKFDPMFAVGLPGPFNREMLLTEYRVVRCPVLVLTGTEPDTWSDLDATERAVRLGCIADVRHHEVPGTGHYIHLEDPAAVVAHVAAFAQEVGP
jgi:pimeloyl-ACP methyl ester carboxylesterase